MSSYEEWCPVCKSPIVMVTRGIPSMGRCMNGHTSDRRDTLRREPEKVEALPTLSAAKELPEVKAMVGALQSSKQHAVAVMPFNTTQTHADLAGCKIALEQAWASNRERAAKITALTEAMTELRAMVVAECPSLLNEDSGGNGELSCQINDLLAGEMTMKTAAGKAADVLLEHIVYYDLVERRGAEIANAVIAELVEIGVKSVQIGAKP